MRAIGLFTNKCGIIAINSRTPYNRLILVICTPPQHGKSLNVIDLIAWMVGHDPNLKVIYASFSDRLCLRANKRMQRSLDDPKYQIIFPDTAISEGMPVQIRLRSPNHS